MFEVGTGIQFTLSILNKKAHFLASFMVWVYSFWLSKFSWLSQHLLSAQIRNYFPYFSKNWGGVFTERRVIQCKIRYVTCHSSAWKGISKTCPTTASASFMGNSSWKARQNSQLLDSSTDRARIWGQEGIMLQGFLGAWTLIPSPPCFALPWLVNHFVLNKDSLISCPLCPCLSWFLPFINTQILEVTQLYEMSQRCTCLQVLGQW